MSIKDIAVGVACGVLFITIYEISCSFVARKPKSPKSPISQSQPQTKDSKNNQFQQHKQIDESVNLLQLFYSLAKDSLRNSYIHRSITCNHCNSSPVRGIRYKCVNCSDYDLCENCESLDVHVKTHVFLKIRIPVPPLANPRFPLLPLFYPGHEFTASTSNNVNWVELTESTLFDILELEACYDQFRSLCTAHSSESEKDEYDCIDRETFEKCLGPIGLEKNLISDRIFAFFDTDHDQLINFKEFVSGLSILCKGTFEDRILFAFKGYDIDGNGFISKQELRRIFKAYFHLSMELVRDVVKTMEQGIMENFDDHDSRPISSSFNAPITSSGSTNNKVIDEESLTLDTDSSRIDHPNNLSGSPTLLNGKISYHREFPTMEAMSQSALDEMVEQTFKDAGAQGKDEMSFEEFVQAAEKDNNLLAWFEALGTIF